MPSASAHLKAWAGFIVVSAAIGAVAAWGAFRGFDFTDEGVYYLSFVHPEEVSDYHTSYHLFGRVLFLLSGQSIAITRLLVVALSIGGAGVFFKGLQRWESVGSAHPPTLPWLIATGASTAAALGLAFATGPVAPSYNLLNAALLYASVGLILSCASEDALSAESRRRFFGLAALIGVCLAADFFVKFSTSVPLAITGGLFLLIGGRASWRRKLQLGALTVAIVALGAAVFFLKVQDFSAWKTGSSGLRSELITGSFLNSYFGRYGTELIEEITLTSLDYSAAWDFLPIAAGILLVLRFWPRWQRWSALLAGLALLRIVAVPARADDVLRQTGVARSKFYMAMLAIAVLAALCSKLVAARPANAPRPFGARTLLLCTWLILLPFFGAVGTTNDISTNLFYQFAPWLIVLALCFRGIERAWQTQWVTPIASALVCAVALCQFQRGFLEERYRVPGPLRMQNEPTSLGSPPSNLRLDHESHVFLNAARAQLDAHGFKPGDDIFAFFNFPGFVFSMGAVSPGHPWYFAGDQRSLDLDSMRVQSVAPARRARAFVVTNGNIDDFLPRLKTLGMDFPSAYVRCGEPLSNPLTHEQVEIWRPKARLLVR